MIAETTKALLRIYDTNFKETDPTYPSMIAVDVEMPSCLLSL